MKEPLRLRILPFVAAIRDRKITGRDVAAKLGVTESWVSKTLKDLGVAKAPREKPSRKENQRLREGRLAHRTQAATTLSITEAAKVCKVHPRTIMRLLATLPKAE